MSCDDAQPAALLPAFDGTPLRAAVSITADAPGFERLESLQRFDAAAALGTGAAPVTDAVKAWIIEHFCACLAEGYGLNETFVVTTMPPELQRAKPGSSGRPYRHVKIEIRDPEGKVLPAGETGEIRVWTPLNVSGYVNAAPLGPDTLDARGFFRTGDVGRLDADGVLYVSDRLKDMLIFGGANVYPAEVERVLGLHPAVMDAPVIGVPDDEMGERVLAFRELKPRLSANCVSRSARTGFARSEIASGLRVELTHPEPHGSRRRSGDRVRRPTVFGRFRPGFVIRRHVLPMIRFDPSSAARDAASHVRPLSRGMTDPRCRSSLGDPADPAAARSAATCRHVLPRLPRG